MNALTSPTTLTPNTLTRSQKLATEIAALLRARTPLIWVVTREEGRAESYLLEAAASASYKSTVKAWDVANGVRDLSGKVITPELALLKSPDEVLTEIFNQAQVETNTVGRSLWILRDFHPWIESNLNCAQVQRQLKSLIRQLPRIPPDQSQAIVILTTSDAVPAELAGFTTVIDWPVPDRVEIGMVLDTVLNSLPETLRAPALLPEFRDAAIDAAIGLTAEEARGCFSKSIVTLKRIDPVLVGQEKKRIIARERVLEWHDPVPGGLDAVGGLDLLKQWLVQRQDAFSPAARAYGLPAPKGVLMVGIPGCGKSLIAKCIATAWGVPLLRLDMGALRSKFVGDSEGNIRKAFQVVESVGRCVLWIDEIEKALAGSTGPAGDGGVASDALGTVLNWMQERQGEAFVCATANDISSLPPELLRKGRFDDTFFVDLPTRQERGGVLKAALRGNKQDAKSIDLDQVIGACEGFSGAEIAAIVPEGMFAAFAEGARKLSTEDLLVAAASVKPLGQLAKEKIDGLRAWAKGKARPASYPEKVVAVSADHARIDM
jgi:SpoVK/Ycf46/Vps4 family AAA+-type ATPase